MNSRVYDIDVAVTASAQPTAGSPSDPTDLITLGYLGSPVEGRRAGSTSTTITLASTPLSQFPFNLRKNGIRIFSPDDYSRSGVTVTLTFTPEVEDVLDWDYRA